MYSSLSFLAALQKYGKYHFAIYDMAIYIAYRAKTAGFHAHIMRPSGASDTSL
jgi:hypothetical protein